MNDKLAVVAASSAKASNVFVGRRATLEHLLSSTHKLSLVVGDSGCGKTQVLRHLQSTAETACSLSEFRGTGGSLQTVLLGAIADILVQWNSQQAAYDRLKIGIERVVQRALTATTSQMGKAAGKFVLSYVKSKVGAEAADLLEGLVKDLATTNDDLLLQRIQEVRDEDVLEAFIGMAYEVQAVVGNLLICVDGAERLTSDDYSALIDLGNRLPDGVRLVASLTVATSSETTRASHASRAGVEVFQLPQLTEGEIAEWLGLVGIDQELAGQVRRLTSGFPVFVDGCIGLIQAGRSLDEIDETAAYRSITEQSWMELTDNAQVVAESLLPFESPLDIELICHLTKLDRRAWVVIENRLRDARIFCETGDGRMWFHDRRRRIIWETTLLEDQRKMIAEEIAPKVMGHFVDSRSITDDVLPSLADLTVLAPGFQGSLPQLSEVAMLQDHELASLFAAFELLEGKSPDEEVPFVDTVQLLGYRRRVFPTLWSAVESIEGLVRSGFLYVASNEHASVAIITIKSVEARIFLDGRFFRSFGKIPLTKAASAIFYVGLIPLLGNFAMAQYGIGRPGVKKLLENTPADSERILLMAESGEREFYATISFGSQDARDEAIERIKCTRIEVFKEELKVIVLAPYPTAVIPADRYLVALEELYELSNRHSVPSVNGSALNAQRAAAAKVEIHEFVKEHSSDVEALAAGCLDGLAVFFDDSHADSLTEIQVRSSKPRLQRVVLPEGLFSDPLHFYKITETLGLESFESVKRITHSSSVRQEPMISTLVELSKATQKFNGRPLRYVLPTDEAKLREDLASAFTVLQRDVEDLGKLRVQPALKPIKGRRGRRFLWLYKGPDPWGGRLRRAYYATELRLPSDMYSLDVFFSDPPFEWDPTDFLDDLLGKHSEERRSSADTYVSSGDASALVSRLLGHSDHAVQIWPESGLVAPPPLTTMATSVPLELE